jgi:uncharacterized protein (DUF488 family)
LKPEIMSEEDILEKIQVWTFGHSNRSMEKFLELLREHEIQVLADVRRFPTSKAKHFKKELMEKWLPEHGVEYVWLGEELGGYRRGGYKKYVTTKLFREEYSGSQKSRSESACASCAWR